eukprot:TRINITY_DN5025_c0_g1_i1.p1 TRINITY_DN5025_c0_g1~~TRINITY_DN5025_c0_g1_i1.p1  ORF type:complete len:248 (+),score=20.50 TRINITY_DN5025_c0_g1_i1:192-935(+)
MFQEQQLFNARQYLQSFSIHALFESLTTDLITNRPKDPIEFIISRLRDTQVARTERSRPRIVFIVGGPGAGKGTQSARLAEHSGCLHLQVGEMLRAHAAGDASLSAVSERLAQDPDASAEDLVLACPTDVLVQFLKGQLLTPTGDPIDATRTVVLDSFPLSLEAAFAFERAVTEIHSVLFLDVPTPVLRERVLKRAATTGRQEARDLDRRLDLWMTKTRPLVEYYSTLTKARRVLCLLSDLHALDLG